jgi:hypothetical protein
MIRFALVICCFLVHSINTAQSPNTRLEWGELSGKSRAVIVGVVDKVSLVIRSDKGISKVKALPNGNAVVELQDPTNYVVGRLFRLRVKEVLKSNGSIRIGGFVNVLIPGPYTTEGQPALIEKKTYVVFLSQLNGDASEFRTAVVYEPGTSINKRAQFAPRYSYRITDDNNGAVDISAPDSKIVNEIKAALRSGQR